MIDSTVARRYARALLSLAGADRAAIEQTAEHLSLVANGIAQSEAAGLLAPGAPRAQQRSLVEAFAGKLEKPLADLLRLLVDRNRFDGLLEIAAAFQSLVDEKLGRVRATISSAAPLSEAELTAASAQLEKATGKQISLDARTDPALIGGVSADVGGLLFDGSVRTQLEKMRQQLRSPGA